MPTRTAHAKVNLFLHVLAREASGYHGIETLFCRIALADTVSVDTGPAGIHVTIDGDVPGHPEDNLVYRAAELFHSRLGRAPAVRIGLAKRIPIGAGLGGGSSDAAATLLALNALRDRPFDAAKLVELGGTLGSDVAYFLTGASLALAWGRGDRMIELDPLPERPVLVVMPATPMPTVEAYRLLAASRERAPAPPARSLAVRSLTTWDAVARLAANDFEDVILEQIDGLASIRDAIREGGASIALLSGSGSALFGVFDDLHRRDRTAAILRDRFPDVRVIETVSAGPGGVDRDPARL